MGWAGAFKVTDGEVHVDDYRKAGDNFVVFELDRVVFLFDGFGLFGGLWGRLRGGANGGTPRGGGASTEDVGVAGAEGHDEGGGERGGCEALDVYLLWVVMSARAVGGIPLCLYPSID